jgi:hypothetical protein
MERRKKPELCCYAIKCESDSLAAKEADLSAKKLPLFADLVILIDEKLRAVSTPFLLSFKFNSVIYKPLSDG